MTNRQLYRRMFRFLRPQMPAFILSVVLSFTVVSLEGLSLWLSAPLVRTLFMPESAPPEKPAWSIANVYEFLKYHTYAYLSEHDPLTALKVVCILIVCAFLAKNVIVYIKHLLIARVNLHVERDLRNTLYRHALHLPVSYYDRNASSSIIALIVRDVSTINASMTNTLDKLLLEPMRIAVFLVMLFAISARLTLAVLLVLPILAVCIGAIGSAVRRRSKRVLQTFSGLIAVLHETVGGIRTVKLFGMENVERDKFNAESQRLVNRSFRSTRVGRLTGPFTESLGVAVAVVLLWFGGREVLSGRGVAPEDFMLFLLYVFSCFKPLKTLSSVNSLLQTGFAAAERVFGVLDSPIEPPPPERPSLAPALEESIVFSNVSFTYPQTDEIVLDGISFEVKQGDIVALVGPSGSGKSTILDLLPRFYEPTRGQVLIDGVDTRTIELHTLRRYFGTVAQETVLFNDTVYNNIAYGTDNPSEQEVIECAEAANAWGFIRKLPQGLHTPVGERGVMLSGGQRQRLAIARALLRNPPVLILDEATSALDTEAERLVQAAINRLMENRTALVVAHRLSTIRHADTILVLDKGRIVERGTHDELLQLNGRYRTLHDMQFSPTE